MEMNIEWYPGHIKKARKDLFQYARYIDVFLEVRDARIISTTYPWGIERWKDKKRIIIFNKQDLADKNITHTFYQAYQKQGWMVHPMSIHNQADKISLLKKLQGLLVRHSKPYLNICVLGFPNVGKSSLINCLGRRKSTSVSSIPGYTKHFHSIEISPKLLLIDMPGIIYPKIKDSELAHKLALCQIIPWSENRLESLADYSLDFFMKYYYTKLGERYFYEKIDIDKDRFWDNLAHRMGVKQRGEYLKQRAMQIFINDIRKGRLGGFSLDRSLN